MILGTSGTRRTRVCLAAVVAAINQNPFLAIWCKEGLPITGSPSHSLVLLGGCRSHCCSSRFQNLSLNFRHSGQFRIQVFTVDVIHDGGPLGLAKAAGDRVADVVG